MSDQEAAQGHEPDADEDALRFGLIEPQPDPEKQEETWARQLGVIRDEMCCMGYSCVFLFCGHDRMEQVDSGRYIGGGSYHARMGLLIESQHQHLNGD